MLNLVREKTTEISFYKAVSKAAENLSIQIRDYTSCEDSFVRELIHDCKYLEQIHYRQGT